MITQRDAQTDTQNWAQGLAHVAHRAAELRAEELERVTRALNEALIEDERAEILAQFDCAVTLWAREQRWHEGLTTAREVFAAVQHWDGMVVAPYALTLAQFAHNYAVQLQQARLFEVAEELLLEAMALLETYGDATHQMLTAHQIGRVRQDSCKYAEAERSYRVSLDLARKLPDRTRIGKNLFQLGQLAQLTDQFEKSAELFREVLALAKDIPFTPLMIAASHQLGLLAQVRGEYEEARRWFQDALAFARTANDARGMASALHQLGMLAQSEGVWARAEELYHASLAQATTLDDPAEAAPTLYQLAQIALARGNSAAAADLCLRSLSLVQTHGDLTAIARVKQLLGTIQRTAAS